MKFIPILFTTMMVQAIIEERKTMTRRIVKPQPPEQDKLEIGEFNPALTNKDGDLYPGPDTFGAISDGEFCVKCPYGKPGDVLWVRETTTILEPEHCDGKMKERFVYKASVSEDEEKAILECIADGWPYQWKPSIFMKKEACRLFLQIESVKVERLQDISDEDALKEGIQLGSYDAKDHSIELFQNLWANINGAESWNANPWIWAITFKKIDRPAGFLTEKTN